MSAIIQTHLSCDGPPNRTQGCEKTFGSHVKCLKVTIHRIDARKLGWRRYSGRDYCPACWNAMTAQERRTRVITIKP